MMTINKKASFALFSAGILTQSTFAVVWNGSESNDFNDGQNWNGNTVPGISNFADFNGNDSSSILTGSGPFTVNGIRSRPNGVATAASFNANGQTVIVDTNNGSDLLATGRNGGTSELTVMGTFQSIPNPSSDPSANSVFNITATPGSSIILDTVTFEGPAQQSSRQDRLRIKGNVTLENSTIEHYFDRTDVVAGSVLTISGSNTVANQLRLHGGSISFSSPADQLEVGNVRTNSNGGNWIFDLSTTGTNPYIIADSLNLANTGLNISGISATATQANPIILASYDPGQLNGTFSSEPNIPGFTVDYNFNGMNQIAVYVPEPTLALPLLAAFFPLIGLRSRPRR